MKDNMNILETAQQIDERKSQELVERSKLIDAISNHNRRWVAIAEKAEIFYADEKAPDADQMKILEFVEFLLKIK